MKLPYKKGLLYSGADWEKFFAIQAQEGSKNEKIYEQKPYKKVKTISKPVRRFKEGRRK